MNNKGFTMVELLVAMAILALLTVMAFPTLRSVQTANSNKKFESYGDTIVSAAKLYTDSYGEDMFSGEDVNYKVVSFEELYKSGLLKDIGVSDTTCLESQVTIAKNGDNYIYCYDIICKGKGSSSGKVYENSSKNKDCKQYATYKITYYNGVDNKQVYVDRVGFGQTYNLRSLEKTPLFKRTHYDFKGWKDKSDNSVKGANAELSNPSRNYDFLATWVGKTYTIKYDSNGGSACPDTVQTYSPNLAWGSLCAPTKTGFTFVKWVDSTGKTFDSSSIVNGNLNLKAVWSIKSQKAPTNNIYKWVNNDTDPKGNTTGLNAFTETGWFSGKVMSIPSKVTGATRYEYTTTGTTSNKTNEAASYRNIESNGTSTIKWRACDSYGCTNWSTEKTVKLDRNKPTCNVSNEATTWSTTGRKIKIGCTDDYSGCTNDSVEKNYTTDKVTDSYTISDKAGNTRSCSYNVYVDVTPPSCSSITGESSTWTKGSRNITVHCSDSTSGCVNSSYSKSYTGSVATDTIKISDKAKNTRNCTVKVYIDNTKPYVMTSCDWRQGAFHALISPRDDHSGIGGYNSYGYNNSSGTRGPFYGITNGEVGDRTCNAAGVCTVTEEIWSLCDKVGNCAYQSNRFKKTCTCCGTHAYKVEG